MSGESGNGHSRWPDFITEWGERMEREQIEAEERPLALYERAVASDEPITFTIVK